MVCALLVAGAPKAAMAQGTKTARGPVTAVSPTSITVKVNDQEMTFAVDSKTHVTAPGGTTKTKAAEAAGNAGPVLTDVVKTGQGVEVTYHEQGMHAASIRALPSVPKPAAPADPAKKAHVASGVVSDVSGTSLTVKGASDEWTFTVDPKTTVIGTGVGTADRKLKEAGSKTTVTEFVHKGDTVSVTYHDVDGAKHAATVRITKKGT
jgi:hypothetical protein